jgi:rfaE bifunctional protein kinase chain/domain
MKIALITGKFNIVHPGHFRLFRFSKEFADKLIVAVEGDQIAGNNIQLNENDRLEGVKLNKWVDEAFIYNDSIEELLERIKPDYLVKGKEHEINFNIEKDIIEKLGGKLIFGSGEIVFSSSDLINNEFNNINNITKPDSFLKRHEIINSRLIKILNDISNKKVCIIGDLIIDEYITCQALGLSQEEPTLVVKPIESIKFIGGAGIVAAHAAGLGADVTFVTISGDDELSTYAQEKLYSYNVKPYFFKDTTRPTTLKQRYRCKGKSLFRVSYLHQDDVNKNIQDQIINLLKNIISDFDVFVFSDFNYGCLPQFIVDEIILLAKKNNILIAADSQSSSQIGDIGRFKNMDLITPTEHEARISTKNQTDGLVVLAEQLKKASNASNILLKMGEEGLLIHSDTDSTNNWLTDKINALNKAPKDTAGAGDSLLITSILSSSAGANIWESAYLGSLAAAIQVGRIGNTPLTISELKRELEQ